MFTGIVEELGRIKDIVQGPRSIKLQIECTRIMEDVKLGDSIAVNGICLTVTSLGSNWFTADVMPETMRKTNLESLTRLSQVNLERALRLSDRLGGHLVSGHIDGTGVITEKVNEDNATWISIAADKSILKYIVMKGSVAVDGTSLTVAYVDDVKFKVSLIPLTRAVTTLGFKKAGDKVNIECDSVGKYVEKLLYSGAGENNERKDISVEFLRENGFA
jgi:riboflavin synthase